MPVIRDAKAAARFVDALLGSWQENVAQGWKDAAVAALMSGDEAGLAVARQLLTEGIREAQEEGKRTS